MIHGHASFRALHDLPSSARCLFDEFVSGISMTEGNEKLVNVVHSSRDHNNKVNTWMPHNCCFSVTSPLRAPRTVLHQ